MPVYKIERKELLKLIKTLEQVRDEYIKDQNELNET